MNTQEVASALMSSHGASTAKDSLGEAITLLLRTDAGRARISQIVAQAAERRYLQPSAT